MKFAMSMDEINRCNRGRFVETLGWVFEHSPWVAERAWEQRPFSGIEGLHSALIAQVVAAGPEEQLALLRAHPDLGTRARISLASTDEQAGAGLDQLTPQEFDLLTRLNSAYRDKFGFPFLLAVKGSTKRDILKALERRVQSGPEEEFREALLQVFRIADFRLRDIVK
jgi:2-oxo-4-hydroxy-4-carboxy-5-ureidoimidazoline decarboxylase